MGYTIQYAYSSCPCLHSSTNLGIAPVVHKLHERRTYWLWPRCAGVCSLHVSCWFLVSGHDGVRRCKPDDEDQNFPHHCDFTCVANGAWSMSGIGSKAARCHYLSGAVRHPGTADVAHRHSRAELVGSERTNTHRRAHTHTQPQAPAPSAHTSPANTLIPASWQTPASQHSRCSAQTRTGGLARTERAGTH
jgi:hypothetical protein